MSLQKRPNGLLTLLTRLHDHEKANMPEQWSSREWRIMFPVLIEQVADDLRGQHLDEPVVEMIRRLDSKTLDSDQQRQLEERIEELLAPARYLVDWAQRHGFVLIEAEPVMGTGYVELSKLGRDLCIEERAHSIVDHGPRAEPRFASEELQNHPIWTLVDVDPQSNRKAHVVMRMFRMKWELRVEDIYPAIASEEARDRADLRLAHDHQAHDDPAIEIPKMPSKQYEVIRSARESIVAQWPKTATWLTALKHRGENPSRLILRREERVTSGKKGG